MIELDGEVYYNAASAARYLCITRFMFYYNVKAKVRVYRTEVCKWSLYKQSELERFRYVLPVAS